MDTCKILTLNQKTQLCQYKPEPTQVAEVYVRGLNILDNPEPIWTNIMLHHSEEDKTAKQIISVILSFSERSRIFHSWVVVSQWLMATVGSKL